MIRGISYRGRLSGYDPEGEVVQVNSQYLWKMACIPECKENAIKKTRNKTYLRKLLGKIDQWTLNVLPSANFYGQNQFQGTWLRLYKVFQGQMAILNYS